MTDDNKRIMTSAIPGMSVADVRRNLGEMRKKWKERKSVAPFYPTEVLSNGMSFEEFALMFVRGHHDKRHNKGKRRQTKKQIKLTSYMSGNHDDDEDDDDDEDGNSVYSDISDHQEDVTEQLPKTKTTRRTTRSKK